MSPTLSVCVLILAIAGTSRSISSKVDFVEEGESPSTSSKEDEDVEVKQTIVVSTKLKNNNRRAFINNESAGLIRAGGKNTKNADSGEVPVVKAYKSVETTRILTPDTRQRTPVVSGYYPDNRRSRDEMDFYPSMTLNPTQWKPSTFYKNINNWNQDRDYSFSVNTPDYTKFQRRISDDGVREFYCRKCRELNGPSRGCGPERRSAWIFESTTPKMKIDGKLVKLN